METSQSDIRIYVACLAAYNNGHLHGVWINADQEAEAVYEAVRAMLATSPIDDAEEYAIHDFEGFEGYPLSECEGIEQVCEIASFISEHGKLAAGLLEHYGCLSDARRALEDHYAGRFDSVADFAQDLTDQTQDVPDHLGFYIDYDAMARDMLISDIFVIELGFQDIRIFWSH